MRRLILLRHAKSDHPPGVADLDRPLDARGRRDGPRIGAVLAADGLVPAHVFVSPARRTQETWALVREHLGSLEAETVPSIYEAAASRLLAAIHSAPDRAGSLMMIGHNPGFQKLGLSLAGTGEPEALATLRDNLPTAAVAVIDFPEAESWEAVAPGTGRLVRLILPRTLAEEEA
ncbi:SixA phosphatase family protein [Methylobacterium organophilum]|uniref:Histidine phosphatase family protein n=1 Tax=Methylobacterium organophilum TaxID=410 RepID=A0ABQ4TDU8_METOR|nr:histidine phosphatase family protein [Methylobacterium organophilum]GJE29234.1 hypothetical protein LKMONMHP_4113 [Methylobacterium organophilum]